MALQAQMIYPPEHLPDQPPRILAHRMVLNPEIALRGETTEQVVRPLLKKVELPLAGEKDHNS